jgi:hypothetical protein
MGAHLPQTSISAESIECFLEDQAFLPSYDLAPAQSPAPVFRQQVLFLGLPVCRRSSLLTGDSWEGVGEEPNHTTAGKPGPL